MQKFIDQKTGRILIFSNVAEMISECRKCHEEKREHNYLREDDWTGRYFSSWQDLEEKFYQPWPEGMKIVDDMLESLRNCELPEPVDVRRRLTWNDKDGDVNVDRYLNNDENYMRRAFRRKTRTQRIVSLICPLGENAVVEHDKIFWRGAALMSAVNLLETAGYSCEVNVIFRSRGSYRSGDYQRDCFMFCPVKEAGAELDQETLTNVVSTWFFRNVVLGCIYLHGTPVMGLGHKCYKYNQHNAHMNIESGCTPFFIGDINDRKSAIAKVEQIIKTMNEGE